MGVKKIHASRKSPTPTPITFLMVRPLALIKGYCQQCENDVYLNKSEEKKVKLFSEGLFSCETDQSKSAN